MKPKKLYAIIVALLLIAGIVAGCAPKAGTAEESSPAPESAPAQSDSTTGPAESETYIFTDSVGREVELPKNIERVAPSGSLAQIVLFTLCPDKIVGLANDLSDVQFDYMDAKYRDLPVLGNFYADTLNLESVMQTAPQVVIDIGQTMPNAADDMDGIQERTGIPSIFVNLEMDTILDAYETLGMVTGETEQAQKIIDYLSNTLKDVEQKANSIPEDKRLKVYYGMDDGLTAVIKGTIHSDVIDYAAGINVSDVEESVRGGAATVSMEQLMLWQPDVAIFAPESIYDQVASRTEWNRINAIKSGKYYEVPNGPYNWMGRPPSVNRIIGMKWLGNLLYPEVFDYDMIAETKEFYELFYHCNVSDDQIKDLLAKSTYKD